MEISEGEMPDFVIPEYLKSFQNILSGIESNIYISILLKKHIAGISA